MKEYKTNEVIELVESGKNVVIDFGASWCNPCVSFAPVFESVSSDAEFEGKLNFVKVDVDTEPDLSVKYGIRNVPTIMFFKDGILKQKKVGAMSKSDFKSFLSENI